MPGEQAWQWFWSASVIEAGFPSAQPFSRPGSEAEGQSQLGLSGYYPPHPVGGQSCRISPHRGRGGAGLPELVVKPVSC